MMLPDTKQQFLSTGRKKATKTVAVQLTRRCTGTHVEDKAQAPDPPDNV